MSIAKFEKISLEEWMKVFTPLRESGQITDKELVDLESTYHNIKLPARATNGSAGYDFFLPFDDVDLLPGQTYVFPTGIKCKIDEGWFLMIVPKSGLGTRFKIRLNNTAGIIDSDYYNCEANEGHIIITVSNELYPEVVANPITQEPEIPKELICHIGKGKGFVQGIFVPFGVAEEAEAPEAKRTGGFGSTN